MSKAAERGCNQHQDKIGEIEVRPCISRQVNRRGHEGCIHPDESCVEPGRLEDRLWDKQKRHEHDREPEQDQSAETPDGNRFDAKPELIAQDDADQRLQNEIVRAGDGKRLGGSDCSVIDWWGFEKCCRAHNGIGPRSEN